MNKLSVSCSIILLSIGVSINTYSQTIKKTTKKSKTVVHKTIQHNDALRDDEAPPLIPPQQEQPAPPQVFNYVEEMPAAPYDWAQYVSSHMHYPDTARKYNMEGRVIIQFIVDEQGNITNVKAIRGIGGGCDEEATRLVMTAPPWKPGKNNGKPVKVNMTVAIVFRPD